MLENVIRPSLLIPLYQVLKEPLTLEEVDAVLSPHLAADQTVIEVHCQTLEGNPFSAVGVYDTVRRGAMRHLFTRCQYHEPIDHFIAIEESAETELLAHFPDRFRRVHGWFETPYM